MKYTCLQVYKFISQFSIDDEFYFTHKQSANCYIIKCHLKNCSYHIHFTLKKEENWTIIVYINHTCSFDNHHD